MRAHRALFLLLLSCLVLAMITGKGALGGIRGLEQWVCSHTAPPPPPYVPPSALTHRALGTGAHRQEGSRTPAE